MSHLNKDGTSIYDHFNETDPVTVSIDMDELARKLEESNYGTTRLFAALIRVRRTIHERRIREYEERGEHDVAEYVRMKGDPVCDALRKLLINEDY